jgi:hypothetical protein
LRSSEPIAGGASIKLAVKSKWPIFGLLILLVANISCDAAYGTGTPHGLELGVPAYVFPGQKPLVTLGSMTPAPGIVVLDPGNGDVGFSGSWQSQADKLRARGTIVLGYVYTDYASRPISAAENSVDNYFRSDSGGVDVSGIFFDQMSTSCSKESYYHQLYQYVQSVDPDAFVADNPGTPVNVCALEPSDKVADTFVTFEDDARAYSATFLGNIVGPSGVYSQGAQYPPSAFWHLVYGASAAQMPQLVALAASRHAGYIYATNDNLPNPYDSVPGYIDVEDRTAATAPSR